MIENIHLITVKSEQVDGNPSVVFGIYNYHQIWCGRGLVKFKLSEPIQQRNLTLVHDLSGVKGIYLQLVRERSRLDGSILYIDPNLMGREFVIPEGLSKYGAIIEDLDVVFEGLFKSKGLSFAFVVPDWIGVRQWVIDYMLHNFEFKGTLKTRGAGC